MIKTVFFSTTIALHLKDTKYNSDVQIGAMKIIYFAVFYTTNQYDSKNNIIPHKRIASVE